MSIETFKKNTFIPVTRCENLLLLFEEINYCNKSTTSSYMRLVAFLFSSHFH